MRILLGACLCAVAVAACGAAAKQGAGSPYGPVSSPASLSRCMRANGLRNFPDPTQGSGGVGFDGLTESSGDTLTVSGVSFSGPALKRAEKACKEYLPPGGPPPPVSESEKLKLLRFAQCMRSHGVSDYPDPTFGASGPAPTKAPPDLSGPVAQRAAKACGGPSGAVFQAVG